MYRLKITHKKDYTRTSRNGYKNMQTVVEELKAQDEMFFKNGGRIAQSLNGAAGKYQDSRKNTVIAEISLWDAG